MKIAVVGNGKSVLDRENGEFIDSCDTVIRMKQYVTDGYEEYTGTKVDIYASKWFSWFSNGTPYAPKNMNHVSDVDEYWFMFCDPYKTHTSKDVYTKMYVEHSLKTDMTRKNGNISLHEQYVDLFNIPISKVRYYPVNLITRLAKQLKLPSYYIKDKKGKDVLVEPSVGIRVLTMALENYPAAEIYITGFDCFLRSSWYWNGHHIINNDHKYLAERVYLQTLINNGSVVEI